MGCLNGLELQNGKQGLNSWGFLWEVDSVDPGFCIMGCLDGLELQNGKQGLNLVDPWMHRRGSG